MGPTHGTLRREDRASFSHSTLLCQNEQVKIDRFQLPVAQQGKGYGTCILNHLLGFYEKAGCSSLVIPAAVGTKGRNCYKKCGFKKNVMGTLAVQFSGDPATTSNTGKAHDKDGVGTPADTQPCTSADRDLGQVKCNLLRDLADASDSDLLADDDFSGLLHISMSAPAAEDPQVERNNSQGISNDSENDSETSSSPADKSSPTIAATTRTGTAATTTATTTAGKSVHMLTQLLRSKAPGRPSANVSSQAVKRRVLRNDQAQKGVAARVAELFDSVIQELNAVHSLSSYPLVMRDLLPHMKEGKAPEICKQLNAFKEDKALAQKTLDVLNTAGRGNKAGVLHVVAKKTENNSIIPSKRLSQLTGYSISYINKCKADKENQGPFVSTKKGRKVPKLCATRKDPKHGECKEGDKCRFLHDCMICKGETHAAVNCPKWNTAAATLNDNRRILNASKLARVAVTDAERVATRKWMHEQNPARSGDNQKIAWMVKSRTDFYYESYRTREGQIAIIQKALDIFGDELRMQASIPTTKWLRNVKVCMDASSDGALDDITVKEDPRPPSDKVDLQQVLDHMNAAANPSFGELDDIEPCEEASDEESDDAGDKGDGVRLLHPRSFRSFYGTCLKGCRLWRRPPHNHCARCEQYSTASERIRTLHDGLIGPSDGDQQKAADVIERAGGRIKAWEELRSLQHAIPDLKKHNDWYNEVRSYVKQREEDRQDHEAIWYVDYGGFNDSANQKVSCWSATIMAKNRLQENFDFFFDQKQSKSDRDEAKARKDGKSGIFFLEEMLDSTKSTLGSEICLFKSIFPDTTHIILSGDTGNGFKGYHMLEKLSNVFQSHGFTVELIPLAPGHAWNKTDARFAHLNKFVDAIKDLSRVFGAEGISKALHAVSSGEYKYKRKFIQRSHIFFRKVKLGESATQIIQSKGNKHPLVSEDLIGGKIGVRGLSYFDFSVKDLNGNLQHLPGYARVREHPDPRRPGNKTFVYSWRKELAKDMCQKCSDAWGGPIPLSKNGCSKRKCVTQKNSSCISIPLEQNSVSVGPSAEETDEGAAEVTVPPNRAARGTKRKRHTAATELTITEKTPRQVRVVHGQAQGGEEIWLYIPEHITDKSGHKRKGWWLYPEPGKKGLYYIGNLDSVQTCVANSKRGTIICDVAVFNDFPFTRTFKKNVETDKAIANTVRCVTDRPLTKNELRDAKGGNEDVMEPAPSDDDDTDYDSTFSDGPGHN